jgi:hypothetical protein
MSTDIARMTSTLPKPTKQQMWALGKACERGEVPETTAERYREMGLFRFRRYEFGTHVIDIAKTEDSYSCDLDVIVADVPSAVWGQIVKKACDKYKRETTNALEFAIAKAETDLKILKRTEALEIIEKMPSDVYYNSIFG